MTNSRHPVTKTHVPVMPKEVLAFLKIFPNGIYVDGTIGNGGIRVLYKANYPAKARAAAAGA